MQMRDAPHRRTRNRAIDVYVGQRLRRGRLEKDYTQSAIASALGVSESCIEAYETGNDRVPPEHLIQISRFLSVSIAFFFGVTPVGSARTNSSAAQ
jgi:transcriptional regulator with XRE-family HTH domain